MKNYHCCATCQCFKAEKNDCGLTYKCTRLGYSTKPNFQFNCWNPREDIQKKLQQDRN